jgi:protein-S-isoprenylcysteine O-methyltransferase Ste14
LRATFPEYEDYAARTPRLVPRFRAWKGRVAGD